MSEKSATKICRNCQIHKPLTEYYTHQAMSDGHLNKCKDCVKRRIGKHRENNLERIQEYDRERGRTEKRKQKCRIYQKSHREETDAAKKAWYQRNRHKRRANSLVGWAIKHGFLKVHPCSVCGSTEKVEGHHPDYSKPLEVIWLCGKHHKEIHRKYQ